MTPDERARATIGRALIDLYRETLGEALPPEISAVLDRLAPPPAPAPAAIPASAPKRRRLWSRDRCS